MMLSEYYDEDLIEEIKHRGIKIEIWNIYYDKSITKLNFRNEGKYNVLKVKIGGVLFDILQEKGV